MIEVQTHPSATDGSVVMSAKISIAEITSERQVQFLVAQVIEAIAARFVEEHYAEIAAKLDQQAIANLAIAEAAKKIAEEIERQPNIVKEVEHHTAVYQRGIFGGMRRVG